MCDEKWILYNNTRRSTHWLDKKKAPKHFPKHEFHQKKSMACKVSPQFLEIRRNNHRLKILSAVRRNAQKVGREKACLNQQKWPNFLRHSPFCQCLSPTNFHFFKHLDNFTTNRQFQNHAAVEEAFKEFIESRDADFYRKGIQSQGCYFD